MRIGVDLGGTKIEAAVLDEAGSIQARQRVATPQDDYEGTVAAVAGLIEEMEQAARATKDQAAGRKPGQAAGSRCSIGVCTPGAISPATGRLKNSNSVCLNGRPFKEDLERLVGRPVPMANDADCLALSEATDGAAAGASPVFAVILGTGVGGGVVVNGALVTGPNAICGEWGHNPLPAPGDDERPGPECYCGRRGCIETFLSGPGLQADHGRATGVALEPVAIAGQAEKGDPQAEASLCRYEERLARALAGVINILDPAVIVLGGGLSHLARLYTSVPRLWAAHVFSDRVDTRLVPPVHGDASGVRGAARLEMPFSMS